ncbi:hypothetical protein K9M79_04705 [Candidatus Woesearchaeota archaeon]|nr:hypothetical protein [Candidatus Woesearchaeota archaeon]
MLENLLKGDVRIDGEGRDATIQFQTEPRDVCISDRLSGLNQYLNMSKGLDGFEYNLINEFLEEKAKNYSSGATSYQEECLSKIEVNREILSGFATDNNQMPEEIMDIATGKIKGLYKWDKRIEAVSSYVSNNELSEGVKNYVLHFTSKRLKRHSRRNEILDGMVNALDIDILYLADSVQDGKFNLHEYMKHESPMNLNSTAETEVKPQYNEVETSASETSGNFLGPEQNVKQDFRLPEQEVMPSYESLMINQYKSSMDSADGRRVNRIMSSFDSFRKELPLFKRIKARFFKKRLMNSYNTLKQVSGTHYDLMSEASSLHSEGFPVPKSLFEGYRPSIMKRLKNGIRSEKNNIMREIADIYGLFNYVGAQKMRMKYSQ